MVEFSEITSDFLDLALKVEIFEVLVGLIVIDPNIGAHVLDPDFGKFIDAGKIRTGNIIQHIQVFKQLNTGLDFISVDLKQPFCHVIEFSFRRKDFLIGKDDFFKHEQNFFFGCIIFFLKPVQAFPG